MSEWDRFLDELGPLSKPTWDAEHSCLEPLVEVDDSEEEMVVTVDLPCVEQRDDIRVAVSEGTLEISAEIRGRVQWERWGTIQRSIQFSAFKRSIALPHAVDPESVNAVFRNGILKISLPKTRKRHTITIE